MQSTEPRTVEPMAAAFYKLMWQIYVEQVWRHNEQAPTNPSQQRSKTEPGNVLWRSDAPS